MEQAAFNDTDRDYLDRAKRYLAGAGVLVHSDMEGPTAMYESFSSGIAERIAVTAKSYRTQMPAEDFAAWIIDHHYQDVAFYEVSTTVIKDVVTETDFHFYSIRMAAW